MEEYTKLDDSFLSFFLIDCVFGQATDNDYIKLSDIPQCAVRKLIEDRILKHYKFYISNYNWMSNLHEHSSHLFSIEDKLNWSKESIQESAFFEVEEDEKEFTFDDDEDDEEITSAQVKNFSSDDLLLNILSELPDDLIEISSDELEEEMKMIFGNLLGEDTFLHDFPQSSFTYQLVDNSAFLLDNSEIVIPDAQPFHNECIFSDKKLKRSENSENINPDDKPKKYRKILPKN